MDTPKGGPVSRRRKKGVRKNEAVKPVVNLSAFPNVFTEEVGYIGATEAGNSLIKTLELLRDAATSAEGRARWEAWEILRNEVEAARRGSVPLPLDLAAQPQLFIAVQAVSAWIDSFAPSYLPNGQTANATATGKEATR